MQFWQGGYVQHQLLFQQGVCLAIELPGELCCSDGETKTASATIDGRALSGERLAILVQRSAADVAVRACFNTRFAIFEGRIAIKDGCTKNGDVAAGANG